MDQRVSDDKSRLHDALKHVVFMTLRGALSCRETLRLRFRVKRGGI